MLQGAGNNPPPFKIGAERNNNFHGHIKKRSSDSDSDSDSGL